MRLNLACIYHYIKLAYFSYAYTAPGMFFVDLSHIREEKEEEEEEERRDDAKRERLCFGRKKTN